ncbi:MAG: hypothetical protein LUM44_22500 [Pyrinomonadaceae bacterium]|nr:hypothetical protein [Pyrinomonadaceae bacterium]
MAEDRSSDRSSREIAVEPTCINNRSSREMSRSQAVELTVVQGKNNGKSFAYDRSSREETP